MTLPEPVDLHLMPPGPPLEENREYFGGDALAVLNPGRREFVLKYVLGEDGVRGIAYKAYMAAGYTAKNNNTASSAAYQLLRDPLVLAAIEELQKERDRQAKMQMRSWVTLATKAQKKLEDYLDGKILLSANAITVIKEVLDRALGRPTQTVEHEVGSRLDSLIKELASRKRLPPPSLPSLPGPAIVEAMVAEIETEIETEMDLGGTGMGRERERV